MSDIDSDNLVPVSSNMHVDMIGNTEKLVSSNRRWKYDDGYDNNKDNDNNDNEDVVDIDASKFLDNKNNSHGIFGKNDDNNNNDINKHHSNMKNSESSRHDKHNDDSENNKQSYSDSEPTKTYTKQEEKKLKMDMIRKLCELKSHGVKISQNYGMHSDLEDMQNEYQLHYDIRSKQTSVQIMSHLLVGILKASEYVNDNYNPFDIKLEGLSNVVSSDMTSYYSVLGDIYEKYNKPGKQSSPEMRLLFMVCGTILSMQVSRATGLGALAESVKKDDKAIKELRKKAEQDTQSVDMRQNQNIGTTTASKKGADEYMNKQHNEALQRMQDIKNLRDRELEAQKLSKMLDAKSNNLQKFKANLVLSSEMPQNNEAEEEPQLTREQLENMRKQRYQEEQVNLEAMRRLAHQKSTNYRASELEQRKKNEMERQNKQLDNILKNIDSDNKIILKSKKKVDGLSNDEVSTNSKESVVSYHPQLSNIMNSTRPKVSDSKEKKTKKKVKKQISDIDNIKFDENIQSILEANNTDIEEISKDDVSIGSNKQKKATNAETEASSLVSLESGERKNNKVDKKYNVIDFGTFSIGSRNKGTKPIITSG